MRKSGQPGATGLKQLRLTMPAHFAPMHPPSNFNGTRLKTRAWLAWRAARALMALAVLHGPASQALAQTVPSPEFKASCEARLPPTKIRVTSLPSSVVYDFSLSVDDITARAHHTAAQGNVTLGLTEAAFQLNVSTQSSKLVSTAGMACMRPTIEVTVQVGPQRVFIGREFAQGSCAFNEIAKHELKHVYANQAQLERTAQLLEKALQQQFGNQVFYGVDGQLNKAFVDGIKANWIPWGQARFKEGDTVHQAIDSPQEYARNNTMCEAEVPRILQSRPRR